MQHEGDIALGRTSTVYVVAIEENGSGIRSFESRNQTQGRCLAGAGWAEEHKELPVLDLKFEVGHRGMAAERLGNSFEPDVRHISYRATPARCRTAS